MFNGNVRLCLWKYLTGFVQGVGLIFAITCGFNFASVDTDKNIIDRGTVTILWLCLFLDNLSRII